MRVAHGRGAGIRRGRRRRVDRGDAVLLHRHGRRSAVRRSEDAGGGDGRGPPSGLRAAGAGRLPRRLRGRAARDHADEQDHRRGTTQVKRWEEARKIVR